MTNVTEMTKSEKEELKTLIRQVKILFKHEHALKKQKDIKEDKVFRLLSPPIVLEKENTCLLSSGSFYSDYDRCLPIILKLIKTYATDSIEAKIRQTNEIIFDEQYNYSLPIMSSKKTKQMQKGWIYYLHADNHTTKIGKTIRAQKIRKKELDSLLPYKTKILAWINVNAIHTTETKLHAFYKEYRINNTEWFQLPQQEIESIKNGIYPALLENQKII